MGTHGPERSGWLVLRLWTETDADRPLRARIIDVSRLDGTERELGVTASARDVCDLVCAWVEAFASGE